jgi:ubiquinone/menaquinone biosynthesis C-methylase UbiE
LEWLKHTQGTTLIGLDISPDMIAQAERNARAYGLTDRVKYVRSNGNHIPFDDGTFEAVFSNGSLHEWADPQGTFNEISRVLKPQGRVFISDLRRDMFPLVKWFLWLSVRPTAMRPGLITSLNAAYTPSELSALAKKTRLATCGIVGNPFGLLLSSAS